MRKWKNVTEKEKSALGSDPAMIDVGTVVEKKFKVLRKLGEGGMGAVFEVENTGNGKHFAMKTVHPHLMQSSAVISRFKDEVRASVMVESDHVVNAVDTGVDEATKTPWLLLELLLGNTLEDEIKTRGALGAEEARWILEQIGAALVAAHTATPNLVVHLDLKPSNVFLATTRTVSRERVVKVLDFGLARFIDASKTAADLTSRSGTLEWMAPEQFEVGQVRPAADVWAYGLIAFFVLTGRCFWRAANVSGSQYRSSAVLAEVLGKPIPSATARVKELSVALTLPAGFDDWLARCVAREESDRFKSAVECVPALLALLPRPSTSKAPPPEAATTRGATAVGAPSVPKDLPPVERSKPPFAPPVQRTEVMRGGPPPPPVIPRTEPMPPTVPSPDRQYSEIATLKHMAAARDVAKVVLVPVPRFTQVHERYEMPVPSKVGWFNEEMPMGMQKASIEVVTDVFTKKRREERFYRWRLPSGDLMDMVWVAAGEFVMGSYEHDTDAFADEKPAHRVRITRGFYLGRFPVTRGQFAKSPIAKDSSIWKKVSFWQDEFHPVVNVSWHESLAFAEWAGLQLVNEANWEYAARGTDGRAYPWGWQQPTSDLCVFGGLAGTRSLRDPRYIGVPSPFGAKHLQGNVWEWCADGMGLYERKESMDPLSFVNASSRVLRGCAWDVHPSVVRAASRHEDSPEVRTVLYGFRLAQGQVSALSRVLRPNTSAASSLPGQAAPVEVNLLGKEQIPGGRKVCINCRQVHFDRVPACPSCMFKGAGGHWWQ